MWCIIFLRQVMQLRCAYFDAARTPYPRQAGTLVTLLMVLARVMKRHDCYRSSKSLPADSRPDSISKEPERGLGGTTHQVSAAPHAASMALESSSRSLEFGGLPSDTTS